MRVVMMGTGQFAEPTFEALLRSRHEVAGLVTQPDRAAGQERGSTRQTGRGMKAIALERSLPVLQPESINTPEAVTALAGLRPEIVVVAAYGQILSREVLGVPPQGGINVHASLLPRYRGAAPVAWAIARGETRTGVTIIRMSVRLDAGDMLAQEAIDVLPDETAGELEARLAPLGARLAMDVLERMEKGNLPAGTKQDPAAVTKAPRLTKEHGRIDWSLPAERICRHVRAMQPWPTAYTFWHRSGMAPFRLIVYKASARPRSGPEQGLTAGQVVVGGHADVLSVAAGEGVVDVRELQPAGKRRMAAAEFLRGHRPREGDRLGPEEP
jgi:methionyl-tRNA formyltransferase